MSVISSVKNHAYKFILFRILPLLAGEADEYKEPEVGRYHFDKSTTSGQYEATVILTGEDTTCLNAPALGMFMGAAWMLGQDDGHSSPALKGGSFRIVIDWSVRTEPIQIDEDRLDPEDLPITFDPSTLGPTMALLLEAASLEDEDTDETPVPGETIDFQSARNRLRGEDP